MMHGHLIILVYMNSHYKVMLLLMEQDLAKLTGFRTQEAKISIIKDISGIIKPSRKVFKDKSS